MAKSSTLALIVLSVTLLFCSFNTTKVNAQSNSTTTNQSVTSDPFSFSEKTITLGIGIVGIATFLWGLKQYRDGRIQKRQETVLSLIQKFKNSKEMKLAKHLVDNFEAHEVDTWNLKRGKIATTPNYYHKRHFKEILRYHNELPSNPDDSLGHDREVSDNGEHDIRNSLDSLLEFLGYVGYLMNIGLITRREAEYFDYYVKKIIEDEWSMRYVRIYKFTMFRMLVMKNGFTLKEPDKRQFPDRFTEYLKNKEWLESYRP